MCQSRANAEAEVSALGYLCLPEVEEVSLLSQLQCPLFLYKTWGRLDQWHLGWGCLDWAEASLIWVLMIPRRTEACNLILAVGEVSTLSGL